MLFHRAGGGLVHSIDVPEGSRRRPASFSENVSPSAKREMRKLRSFAVELGFALEEVSTTGAQLGDQNAV